MAKNGYKSVRLRDAVHDKILRIKSPGESIAQCIERAVSLLVEIKTLSQNFCDSPDYQAYLKRHREG